MNRRGFLAGSIGALGALPVLGASTLSKQGLPRGFMTADETRAVTNLPPAPNEQWMRIRVAMCERFGWTLADFDSHMSRPEFDRWVNFYRRGRLPG